MILVSITIILMNFFIVIVNDALLDAKNSVKDNEIYDLVDELEWKSTRERKDFFDAISNGIRRLKVRKTAKEALQLLNIIRGTVRRVTLI